MLELIVPRHKKYKFGTKTVIRLIIFFFIITVSIMFLSGNSFNINTDYDLTPYTQYLKIPQTPAILNVQEKLTEIKDQGLTFFDNQIKEVKKSLIRKVADDMINNIDQKQP